MSSGVIERQLGGETGRRSLLGSGSKRGRTKGFVASFLLFVAIAVIWTPFAGLVLGLLAAGASMLLTLKTGAGLNPLVRWKANQRILERAKTGRSRFLPVRERPADLDERVTSGSRDERKAALLEWNGYRDVHDAADGLTWLQAVRGKPGIAWHVPPGEEAYLSVVFPVAGQIRGLESDRKISRLAKAFGKMAAQHGELTSKVQRLQLVARLLPVDTAAHEAWLVENLDKEDAPEELVGSYAHLVQQLQGGRGGLQQRHFVVARWPVTAKLLSDGSRRGEGVPGLIRLMGSEIDALGRRLAAAGMNPGPALTAAQVSAICRHQQMPTWPLDQAGDLDPSDPDPWLPEEDMIDHSVVTGLGPDQGLEDESGQPRLVEQTWFHVTARVQIEEIETGPKTPTWLLPLLTRMDAPVIRTVALELETIPATQARREAREDLTADLADLHTQSKKGQITSDDLEAAKKAVSHRVDDLAPGSGHHGLAWAMHLTISAPSRDGLIESMDLVDEAAAECGLGELGWIDGAGVAHHGYTLPFARAMAPPKANTLERARSLMSGKGRKGGLR